MNRIVFYEMVSWIETSRMHGGGKEKSMGYYIMWM